VKLLVLAGGVDSSTLDPAALWLCDLTERLASRGHHVSILCTQASEGAEPPPDPQGVAVLRAPEAGFLGALGFELASEPDLVHVAVTGPLPTGAAGLLERAPILLDLLDWSPLCPAGDLLQRPHGEPCHQHYPVAPCGSCAGHLRVRSMHALACLARAGHRLVAHAGHVRDRATLALGRGVSLLPVGVDTMRFSPDAHAPLSPDVAALASDRSRPRVLLLGPPTPARGGHRVLDLLVALHARLPGVELVVTGEDPGHPDHHHVLLAEAKELGIAAQLRRVPRVSGADLPALLAAADVGVAPGLAVDPLGLAIMQAQATGLPVVAHPAGATPYLMQDGRAGVLASALPMGAFADAVVELLQDPERRASLAEASRLAAIEHHDLERAVFDHETLYARVCEPRGRRAAHAAERERRAAA